MIGKYITGTADSETNAEHAFRRALSLDPHLSVAHQFYAHLEADIGQAQEALVRVMNEAGRHRNDPELFAGLVHTCRYCGLYEESIAAHAEARRLDPNVATSLEGTLLMTGEVDRLLSLERPAVDAGADEGIRVMALGLAGRREETRRTLRNMRPAPIPAFRAWTGALMSWLDGRPDEMVSALRDLGALKIQDDPEAMFMLADAEAGRQRALAAFRQTDGERLLGR